MSRCVEDIESYVAKIERVALIDPYRCIKRVFWMRDNGAASLLMRLVDAPRVIGVTALKCRYDFPSNRCRW